MSFQVALQTRPHLNLTMIDNWDELLDPPETGAIIIRAHKNWLARLGLVAVCVKLGFKTLLMNDQPCWPCCDSYITHETRMASAIYRPKKRKNDSRSGKNRTRQYTVDDEDSLEAFLGENDLDVVEDETYPHTEFNALSLETEGEIDGRQDGIDETRPMRRNRIAVVY